MRFRAFCSPKIRAQCFPQLHWRPSSSAALSFCHTKKFYNPALGICRLKEAAATATPDIAATQRVEIREGRRCPTMPIRLTVGMMPPARISTNTWPGWNDFLFARACFAAAVNRWLPGAKITLRNGNRRQAASSVRSRATDSTSLNVAGSLTAWSARGALASIFRCYRIIRNPIAISTKAKVHIAK